MNKIRLQTFTDAGVTDPKTTTCDVKVNIEKEVRKIRALIQRYKYAAEIHQHTDITKCTPLGKRSGKFYCNCKKEYYGMFT